MQSIILILSDARGIYIPRDFICDDNNEIAIERCRAWGLNETNEHQWRDAANPESEHYWDAWEWVLNNAKYITKDGDVYHLHQDGDLFGICYDKMSEDEKYSFLGE